ncbi:bifunctional folylpolyglutamate synthase/dihydrofolate synthase, partial [Chloroflexota bacterium]
CVITSLSLDHTDVLGDTLTEIATEKAGIIKPGSIVISSPQTDEADKVIAGVCREKEVELVRVGSDVTWQNLAYKDGKQSFSVKGRHSDYELSLPLLGKHQVENATTAVAALEALSQKDPRITEEAIIEGIAGVNWPGRLQVLSRRPLLVADGAHNPYSAGKLRESLKEYFDFKGGILIIGASADKDITGMVSELVPVFERVIITRSTHPRAMPVETLVSEFRKHGVETHIAEDISTALPEALALAGEDDIICVTGSLFVAAGAIEQAKELGLTA